MALEPMLTPHFVLQDWMPSFTRLSIQLRLGLPLRFFGGAPSSLLCHLSFFLSILPSVCILLFFKNIQENWPAITYNLNPPGRFQSSFFIIQNLAVLMSMDRFCHQMFLEQKVKVKKSQISKCWVQLVFVCSTTTVLLTSLCQEEH